MRTCIRWTTAVVGVLGCVAVSSTAVADTFRVPDEYPSIQAAVDAAASAGGDGHTVAVARGTYRGNVVVLDAVGLTVRGAPGATIIGEFDQQTGNDVFQIFSSNDVTVRGFVIRGGADDVMDIEASTDVTISRCEISGGLGEGIDIDVQSRNVRIIGCNIHDIATDGVNAEEQVSIVVQRTRFRNVGRDGVHISDLSSAIVSRCRFEDIAEDGVHVVGTDGIVVERCRFERVNGEGINLASGEPTLSANNCLISRNRIFGAARDAIDLNGDGNRIERNVIRDAGQDGIEEDDSTNANRDNVIDRNRIIDSGRDGVRVDGAMTRVRRNRIFNCGEDGIELDPTSTDTEIQRNVIKGHAAVGVRALAGATTMIKNRVIRGTAGIQVSGAGSELSLNVVSAPSGVGIDVLGTSVSLERNSVRKAGTNGIRLDATGGNTLTLNRATGSGIFDLLDPTDGGNTLDRNRFRTLGP